MLCMEPSTTPPDNDWSTDTHKCGVQGTVSVNFVY